MGDLSGDNLLKPQGDETERAASQLHLYLTVFYFI